MSLKDNTCIPPPAAVTEPSGTIFRMAALAARLSGIVAEGSATVLEGSEILASGDATVYELVLLTE
jgi:hypothetical protein